MTDQSPPAAGGRARWKTALLLGGAVPVLGIALLILLPLLFRGRIEAMARDGLDRALDARVHVGGTGLTLLRDFPDLTLSLDDLSVVGTGRFDGDTLAHVPRFRVVVDLGSAWGAYRRGEQLVVRSIDIERPYIHARVLEDGAASWDVLRGSERSPGADAADPDAPTRPFRGALRRLEIEDARIVYDDAASSLHARIEGLDHTLSGDFALDRFALAAETVIDRATVSQHGVTFLSGARVEMNADLDADMASRRFTFRENHLRIGELGLGFDGSFALRDEGTDIALTFAADRADLRHVLSLIPAIYTQDFASLRTSGNVRVNGHVKGAYGPGDFPAFALNVDVADGGFRYPDLPLPARGINVALAVTNPGGHADSTVAELSRFDVVLGDEPFSATLTAATPISDPEIDLATRGRIDLTGLSRTIRLEGLDELRGVVTTDAAVRTRLSYIEEARYDRVAASGTIEIRDLLARGADLPHPVHVDEMRLELAPGGAALRSLRARVGSSDFRATGTLENPLGFAMLGEPLRGSATITSDYLALDEWRSENADAREVVPVPPRLDLALTANVGRMTFGDLEMRDARGTLRMRDARVTLDSFAMRTLDGEIVTTGWYDTSDPGRPAFALDLAMREIDIPGAFAAFNTVRALAPAAGYATGRFTADLEVNGALGEGMAPVLDVLSGAGAIRAAGAALRGLPAMHRVAEALHIERLRDPALEDFAASFEIRDGRLHVKPFNVRMGGTTINVTGSNAFDQSIDYRLVLQVPRSELGAEAGRIVTSLVSRSEQAGFDLGAMEAVRLGASVVGTMREPTVRLEPGSASAAGASLVQAVNRRVRDEVGERAEVVEQRVAEARAQTSAEARARADVLVREAEARAAAVRAEAAELAASVRGEGNAQADRLLAEASNPIARAAARPAADRIRREADERATRITTEADRRAEQIVAAARGQADALMGGTG
jgi:hypothetical protein